MMPKLSTDRKYIICEHEGHVVWDGELVDIDNAKLILKNVKETYPTTDYKIYELKELKER
jgi:hypothetical protein